MADLYDIQIYKIKGYEVLSIEYVFKSTRILKVKKSDNGLIFGIKLLLDMKGKDVMQKEIDILQAIKSPYVIQCYGVIDVTYNNENYHGVVMEFCSHYNIRYLIDFCTEKKTLFPMSKIAYVIYCVVHGLYDLNIMGIVHRDIKPENIFVTEANEIKIGDFGISTLLPDGKTIQCNDGVGTFNYMPPELFSDNILISSKTDVWGVGCVLFELCTLKSLFNSPLEIIPFESIDKKDNLPTINNDILDVLRVCLTKQFDQRKSIQDLLTYLNNGFFTRYLPPLQDMILPPNFAVENLEKFDKMENNGNFSMRQLVQNAPPIRVLPIPESQKQQSLPSDREKDYIDKINELQDKLLVLKKTKFHSNGMRKDIDDETDNSSHDLLMIEENNTLKKELKQTKEQLENMTRTFNGTDNVQLQTLSKELTQTKMDTQKLSQSIAQLENERNLLLQQNCQMSKLLTEKDIIINHMTIKPRTNSQSVLNCASTDPNPQGLTPSYCVVKSNIYPGGSIVFPPNVPKSKFVLAYRSSVNGSSKSIFHSICDVKKRTATLYILQTKENEHIFIYQGQGNLKLPNLKKYPLLDSEVLIMIIKNKTWYTFETNNPVKAFYYDPEFGPIFGTSGDPCLKLDMVSAKIEIHCKTEEIYNIPWKNLLSLQSAFFRSYLYTTITDMEVYFEQRD